MIIYAGIDGTSTEGEEGYKVTFKNSFVNRMARNEVVPFDDAFYHRGPSLFGHETSAQARMAYTWVVTRWKTGRAKAVFLAGYSRGAAAVIEVAYWLKSDGIPVECLILFDAVDRSTPGPGGGVGGVFQNRKIADNVTQTIHPMRNIMTTRSRVSFQRCGDTQENPQMPHAREYFFATHGGVGGTPWTKSVLPGTDIPNPTGYIWEDGELLSSVVTPAMDIAGAAVVSSWAYPQIISAFQKCQARLEAPPEQWIPEGPGGKPEDPRWGPQPDRPRYGPPPRNGQKIHVVQPGDWLSKIAITYYGDMNKWKVIYDHNKETIGPNPDLIKPGQRLAIP